MIDFNIWKDVLMEPIKTFKQQEKKADLTQGLIHIAIAGVISGFFTGIAALMGMGALGAMGGVSASLMGAGIGAMAFVISLIVTPIITVIGFIVISAIIYIFAMIFGGKGDYVKQTYLIALYAAPLIVINSVVGLIPFLGGLIAFLVSLYGLYLLTMALKQAHKVSTGKAVAIWIVPILAMIVLAVILGFGFFMAMSPIMAAGA